MKRAISLLVLVSMLAMMMVSLTGCGDTVAGRFVRTKEEMNIISYDTLTLSNDTAKREKSFYDSRTGEYSSSDPTTGTYVCEDNMVYITWSDGRRDAFVYVEAAGTLSHTVEDWWVYYKE